MKEKKTMANFYYISSENAVFDADIIDIAVIAEDILSDDEYSDMTSVATEWDEDGEPCEWEQVDVSEQEWLDAIEGSLIDSPQVAVDLVLEGAEYQGVVLKQAVAEQKADPEYLEVKDELKSLLTTDGWVCVRDKNNSAYFERAGLRVRFSNHELSNDWTGRAQTGGADFGVVWAYGQSASDIADEINDEADSLEV